MLLTINNLPSHIGYSDVKALISSKCGPLEIILDNLVTRNKFKTVTVGLADEADAAILVRKLNGLFMEGAQLYVEDSRRAKTQEQPYRSGNTQSNAPEGLSCHINYGFPSINSNMILSQPVMPMNSNLSSHDGSYGTHLAPDVQNAGFMAYGQPMVHNTPVVPMQEQSFNENLHFSKPILDQPEDGNNYLPSTKKSRWEESNQHNDRHNSRRDSYQFSSKIGPEGHQNSRGNRKPNTKSLAFEHKRNERDGCNDRYSNQKDYQKSRPNYAADQQARNSSNTHGDHYGGNLSNMRQDNRGQRASLQRDTYSESQALGAMHTNRFDVFSYKFTSQPDPEVKEQQRLVQVPNYYERENFGLEPQYLCNAKSHSGVKASYTRTRDFSDTFQDRRISDNSYNGFNDSYNKHRSSYCEFDQFSQPQETSDISGTRGIHNSEYDHSLPQRNDHNIIEYRKRPYDDKPYGAFQSTHSQLEWTTPNSPSRSSKNDFQGREGPSKFYESAEMCKVSNKPRRDPVSRLDDRRDSRGMKQSYELCDRKGSLKWVPHDERSGLDKPSHAALRATAWKERSQLTKKTPIVAGIKTRFASQSKYPAKAVQYSKSVTSLLNKDQTLRGQATAKIAKDIICNLQIQPEESKYILKPLKVSIRSRLGLIIGEEILSSMEEIVQRYRQNFPKKQDAAFVDAILKNNEKKESKLLKTNAEKQVSSNAPEAVVPEKRIIKKKPVPKISVSKPAETNSYKIPKYPKADKDQMKKQKLQGKQEFLNENLYELPEDLKNILNEELEAICTPLLDYECTQEDEKKITDLIKKKSIPGIKKAIRLNVTKRLLSIHSNLLVRIYFNGKITKGDELNTFLKKYGVESCRKDRSNKFLVATCDTFDNYDKLLALPPTSIGGCSIISKPLHLTGFQPRPPQKKVAKQRANLIKKQITPADQSDAIEDKTDMELHENADDLEDY